MEILHYALGFPPYRSGGLTKYVMDLMLEQLQQGDKVSLLWPGAYGLFRHGNWVKRGKDFRGIQSYELRNPLPVPLMDGIKDIFLYTKKGNFEVYREFLKKLAPDILHVHTLMGIHRELFQAADELGIPVIYTAHDYFPICPRVTLYCNDKVCSGMSDRCASCNQTALPFWKIVLLQSRLYRCMKEMKIVRVMRSRHKKLSIVQQKVSRQNEAGISAGIYDNLGKYYRDCMSYVSCVHYGSELSMRQYIQHGIELPGQYIPITHRGITDQRTLRRVHGDVQFAFLANLLPYKGFGFLLGSMDELWKEGIRTFTLHIYSGIKAERPYIVSHPPYKDEELDSVLANIDMVLVPSLWSETFGLVVLEALSHGVPVLVSENVGAKKLVGDDNRSKGMIIEPDKDHLKQAIKYICQNPMQIEMFSKNILADTFDYGITKHCESIKQLYRHVQKE